MPTGGDVVELVHEQTYLGQNVNNVYYFESVDGSTPLSTLAAWFETNVVPVVKNLQSNLVGHTNLRLRNLFDLAETYEEPLTGTGAQATTNGEMPSFYAFSIRFDHSNGEVRSGFKRYAGVDEGQFADALLVAGTVTLLDAIAAPLINPLTPALASWAHVVINRVCDEPNPILGAVPRCLKYRLPANQAESAPGYPTSYEVYSQPTTQNSRKWYT